MDKNDLNLVIFDDQEQPSSTLQMHKYTTKSKNSKPINGNGHNSQKNLKKSEHDAIKKNDHDPIKKNKHNSVDQLISKQIVQLQRKIKALQKQGQIIKFQLQKRNDGNISNLPPNPSSNMSKLKQIEQVLLVVEKKIQLVIQQSKKLVQKMSETVSTKLAQIEKKKLNNHNKPAKSQSNSQNQKYSAQLFEVEAAFKQKIHQYQKNYQTEFQKMLKENKRKEQTMMKKLAEVELKFINKLNNFESKQKEYVDWIHHLEGKLKERKSKKMITITQQKPQLTPVMSKQPIPSNQNLHNQSNLQNVPSGNFQGSKMNCSIEQNSKIARKHKIFGGKSVSPCPKDNVNISPTKDSQIGYRQIRHQNQPSRQSFVKHNQRGDNMNFYSELKKQSNVRQVKPDMRRPNQGWDKFADLNQFSEEYTESQSDDFFTPIDSPQHKINYERVLANIPLDSRGGTYYGQGFRNQTSQMNNIRFQESGQKVFSPFDIN